MDDAVKVRAAALRAKWDAEDAALSSDALRMRARLANFVMALQVALSKKTTARVELEDDLDEYEPAQGWINVSARVIGVRGVECRPMITVRIDVIEDEASYTIEDQGSNSAYLSGTPFLGADLVTKETAVDEAVDVIVETLAHFMARGARLDQSA